MDGGREALAALERARDAGDRPSPGALDAMMPEMDGFTLAERIRQRPELVGDHRHDAVVGQPPRGRGPMPGAGGRRLPDQAHPPIRRCWMRS